MGKSVQTIYQNAFEDCSDLKSIELPASLAIIDGEAFLRSGLESLVIPNSVEKIKWSAFKACQNLSNVIIGNSVKEIGYNAFAECKSLISVRLGNSVQKIGMYAFQDCKSLTTIMFPNSVTDISISRVFDRSNGLSTIISKIENLNTLKIATNEFKDVDKTKCTLYVPSGKIADYKTKAPWKDFIIKEIVDVTGVSLDTNSVNLGTGDSIQLKATIKPDTASNKSIIWSSNNKQVATVDNNGKVIGTKQGTAIIKATTLDGDKTATCTIHVADVSVDSIKLNIKEKQIAVNEEFNLSHTIKPDNATNKNVTWSSSNNAVATVDSTGKVKGIKVGSATIKVTTEDGNKTATCKVTVVIPVQDISLNFTYKSIVKNSTLQLTATVKPDNATNKNVTWSSGNDAVATVDENGLVKGKSVGETLITVTTEDGNHTANCKITVEEKEVKVTSVSLNFTNKSIVKGATFQLEAIVNPDNATNKNVTWSSSNDAIATVDENGLVKGKSVGETLITVTTKDGNHTANCKITVEEKEIKVTSVSLNFTNKSIVKNSTFKLTATVKPDNATNKNVTWSSSNDAVATVDADGLVTSKSVGETIITVTTEDGNHTATCAITVVEQEVKVTSVSLNFTNKSIVKGATFQLEATINPDNATNKNVTWSSSNDAIATVDANGLVKGKSVGETLITVTTKDGNHTANCKITVEEKEIKVTSVSLNFTNKSIIKGATFQLEAIVNPDNATNKNVTWNSSNDAIATVDENGLVKGKSVGETLITVTTEDGNHTANCAITVVEQEVKVTSVSLNFTEKSIVKGATFQLEAIVNPDNATNKNVTWRSSNDAVATVSNTGNVTGVEKGTATITVETEDGNYTATCAITVTAATGIDDIDNTALILQPNLVETHFTVTISGKSSVLEIYNINGKKIRSIAITGNKQIVNVSDLKSGIYIAKINNKVTKFVKR